MKGKVNRMEVEYKKDLRHNYMIITEMNQQKLEPYCLKVLEHQKLEGMLPVDLRYMNNKALLYCDISAKQSMVNLLDRSNLTYEIVKLICSKILSTIELAYEYLMSEDDFVLSPEYIYMDVVTKQPYLIYYCGYGKSIKEQMCTLIEYLMNKVDYKDKEAVVMVYRLYAVSREEGFTFEHLIEVLESNNTAGIENSSLKGEPSETQNQGDMFYKPTVKHNRDIQYKEIQPEERQFKEHQNGKIQNGELYMYGNASQNPLHDNTKYKKEDWKGKNKLFMEDLKSNKLIQKGVGLKGIILNHKQEEKNLASERKGSRNLNLGVGIPVMMEKLEGETEVPCYPIKTYLYTGLCILGGVIIIILTVSSKILYNTFGNRIDISKLFALLLIITCVEAYLLKTLWDKKHRITKIIPKHEYIDPRQDFYRSGRIEKNTKLKKTNEANKRDETLSQSGSNIKEIYHENLSNTNLYNELNSQNSNTELYKGINSYQLKADSDKSSYASIEDDMGEINPTCILNATPDSEPSFILKSVDEVNYPSIIIINFPFFIGKLKRNVDYCLEKDVVSRYHAKITREEDQFFITDLNSTNGTYVNQEALQTYQKKNIMFGDEIAFANIKYQFIQS